MKLKKIVIVTLAAHGAFGAAYAQQEAQKIERVEVTGSSIKRLQSESAAPVQIITREDIEKTGATSVEQLMRTISAVNSSNATVAASAAGATTGGISTVSLRGLTAERTLVLINGKRVAAYGAPNSSVQVDVDSIPIAAIERVEVLKDGASAIYGSDAIAGVINFILRKDYQGGEVTVGYGAPSDGKGSVAKLNGVLGFGELSKDGYNILVTGSYQKDAKLVGADRDFAKTAVRLDRDNFNGSSRSNPGNIAIPGVAGVRNPLVSNGVGNCAPLGVYVPEFNPNICLFDTAPFVTLVPETERSSLGVAGRIQASSSLELYGNLDFTKKTARTVIQPAPIDAAFSIPFRLASTSPFYPTAFVQNLTGGPTPTLNVRYRPFITGLRDLTDTGEAVRLVLGAQGTVDAWDFDTNFLHSASKVSEKLNGGYFRINTDASGPGIVPLLASGQVNPFGANTPQIEAQAKATNLIGNAFQTNTSLTGVQGKASRELGQIAGGAIGVAIGGEYRQEKFKLDSNDALGTGNISGYGGNFVDTDVTRKVAGAFAELSLPVTKTLQADIALRYDSFGKSTNPNSAASGAAVLDTLESVAGDALPQSVVNTVAGQSVGNSPSFSKATGKLGIRWRPISEVMVRSTLSTGYRAPSLLDLFGPLQAGTSSVQNDPARCIGANSGNPDDCATQFNVYSGGRNNLKPEASRNATIGLVLQPTKDTTIGIDYYFLRVTNLVQTLASSYILENESAYRSRVTRGAPDTANGLPGSIIAIDQRLENLGKAYVSGVDFDFSTRFNTDIGRITTELNGTYTGKWKSQNPDGTYDNAINTSSSAVTGVIPRVKYTATVSWNRGPWSSSVAYNWQNSYGDVCGNLLQDDFGNCPADFVGRVGAYETWDVQAKYTGFKDFSLSAGIRNLLDRDPPYVNGSGGAFQSGYDPTYVDPRGRYFYVNATYKFK